MLSSLKRDFNNIWFNQCPFWLAAFIIILFTFIVYFPTFSGGFIWDDNFNLVNNPLLTAQDGLRQIWLRRVSPLSQGAQNYPLTATTLWVERQLWGLQPIGYHLVNIAFHSGNAILFWLLLRRLKIKGAWLAGMIFALHPVHVESVAWITELKNVQSGFFYLLALVGYIRFEEDRRKWWYVVALLMFILALLSKTSTVMLPVILLLYRWWAGRSWRWRDAYGVLPFFALSALAAIGTIWFEKYSVGAAGSEWSAGLPERVAVAGHIVWFYLIKLFVPYNLIFFYPRWSIDPRLISSYLPAAGLLILFAILWWQRRGWGRPIFAGFGYFIISLFPVLGFFNIYFMRFSFVADHFQYLASMGVIALCVGSAGWGVEGLGLSKAKLVSGWYKLGAGLVVMVLLVLGLLTWRQGYIYKNEETLWRDTINKNPGAWMAHMNLGVIYGKRKRHDDAFKEFQIVLRLRPEDEQAHFNLGLAYAMKGRFYEAVEEFQIALRLNPYYGDAHINLGAAYLDLGMFDEAIKEFKAALRFTPDSLKAKQNLEKALNLKRYKR